MTRLRWFEGSQDDPAEHEQEAGRPHQDQQKVEGLPEEGQ